MKFKEFIEVAFCCDFILEERNCVCQELLAINGPEALFDHPEYADRPIWRIYTREEEGKIAMYVVLEPE